MNEKDLKIAQMAKDNHVWIDAMRCIKPTDDFAAKIGYLILQNLNNKDMLLSDDNPIAESQMLYMSFNKS